MAIIGADGKIKSMTSSDALARTGYTQGQKINTIKPISVISNATGLEAPRSIKDNQITRGQRNILKGIQNTSGVQGLIEAQKNPALNLALTENAYVKSKSGAGAADAYMVSLQQNTATIDNKKGQISAKLPNGIILLGAAAIAFMLGKKK